MCLHLKTSRNRPLLLILQSQDAGGGGGFFFNEHP